MTVTDESSPAVRRPSSWLLAVAVVLVLASVLWAAVVATSSDDAAENPSPLRVSTLDAASLDARAVHLVEVQQRALSDDDRAEYLATWAADAASQRQARLIFGNLDKLEADVILRRVAAEDLVTGVDPGSTWDAAVEATWTLATDGSAASSKLTFTFAPAGDGTAKVAAVRPQNDGREPVWLTEPLSVRRGPGWLVGAATADQAHRLQRDLVRVLAHVRAAVGRRVTGVTVYAPSSPAEMEAMTGAAPRQYEGIAASTVSIDGSRLRTAPVAVLLNPDVYGRLDARGRTVVLAHEVTHALTGVATVDMPLWLAEGFADYVAVSTVDVPVAVAARLAVRSAARAGVPAELPGQAAFGHSGSQLEVAYEQSMLAVRSIAERQGDAALLRFYRAVVAEPSNLEAAARAELGIGIDHVTRQWRLDLQRLLDA